MKKHHFTEAQIQELQGNPYTKSVSPSTLKFTEDFKKKFWEQYLEGVKPKEIFVNLGYNPETLGDRRIANTAYLIINKFADHQSSDKAQADELAAVKKRLACLEKSFDYLKKAIALVNSQEQHGV